MSSNYMNYLIWSYLITKISLLWSFKEFYVHDLKQFSHEWNKNINIKLKKLDFYQSKTDSSLYILTFSLVNSQGRAGPPSF